MFKLNVAVEQKQFGPSSISKDEDFRVGVLLESGEFHVIEPAPLGQATAWDVKEQKPEWEGRLPEGSEVLACAKDPHNCQLNLFLVKTDKVEEEEEKQEGDEDGEKADKEDDSDEERADGQDQIPDKQENPEGEESIARAMSKFGADT